MLAKIVCLLLALNATVNNVVAIYCNFTFIESDSADVVSKAAQTHIVMPNDSSGQAFNCDQNLDEFEFVNDSGKIEGVGNRFNSGENFELQELSCIASKRFITPRALNNIYNQLTPVVNSATFVQKIQITECRTFRETCNEQMFPSAHYRYICWQEYLIIKLQALHHIGTIYDEDFYYPSFCSCRLVRVTRRSRKAEIVYV